jgi:5'-nucleotidase
MFGRVVLTNDDGWDAPGLAALREAAADFGDCRVVAPSGPVSNCGHAVTSQAPISVSQPEEGQFAVTGTPADCVRLALFELATRPSWVIAGINFGGNLGADIHYSGTVAAVREAVIHGVPGIAVSQYIARGRALDWSRAARLARVVLEKLMGEPWEPGSFWNVNLPHLVPDARDPEIVVCSLDPSPLPLNYRFEGGHAFYAGDYQGRARVPGGDVEVCFGGRIAATLVRVWPRHLAISSGDPVDDRSGGIKG